MRIKLLVGLLLIASIMIGSIPTAMAVDQDRDRDRDCWVDGVPPKDGICLDYTCVCFDECICDYLYCTCSCCS